MNSNVRIAAGIAIIILGLLVIITPRYLFPVCEDDHGDAATEISIWGAIADGITGTDVALAQDGMDTMTDGMDNMETTTGTMTDMDGMDGMGTTTGTMDDMDESMEDTDMDMDEDMEGMAMGSSHADCYYTSRGALMLGLLTMLAGVAMMLAASASAMRMVSLMAGGLGAAVILLPTYFLPICENPQMQCHDGSEPLLIVLGALVILIAAVMAAMAGKDRPPLQS